MSSNSAVAPHEYKTLPDGHIRILVLQPALERDAPLQFAFHNGRISDFVGRFEAVSYCWGEQQPDSPLHCEDGSSIHITKNLDLALRRLRHKLDARWLWADAACINQADLDEKAIQVPLMGRVFGGAKKVIAWLGAGNGQDEAGMQSLERLCLLKTTVNCNDEMASIDTNLSSIGELFDLPWFRRIWTIQESVLNFDVTLICGDTEITMGKLSTGLRVCSNNVQWTSLVDESPGTRAILKIVRLWNVWWRSNIESASHSTEQHYLLDILHLVNLFPDHGCHDERDRIYAVYGMASNIRPTDQSTDETVLNATEDMVLLDVDYSLNYRELYTAFSIACMRSGRTTQLLQAALRRHNQDSSDWPSWLPDWSAAPLSGSGQNILSPFPTTWNSEGRVSFTGDSTENWIELAISSEGRFYNK